MSRTMYTLWRGGLAGGIALYLVGCQGLGKPRMLPAEVRITNNRYWYIDFQCQRECVQQDPGQRQQWGEGCCIRLPEQWQPDMVATVEWGKYPSSDTNSGGVKAPRWNSDGTVSPEWEKWMAIHKANYTRHQVRVPVPKYQESASLNLIFLPCDEVYPLIDATQRSYVLGNLSYVKDVGKEVVRRLSKENSCPGK